MVFLQPILRGLPKAIQSGSFQALPLFQALTQHMYTRRHPKGLWLQIPTK